MASLNNLPEFPRLTADNNQITRPRDRLYNCIAWAAGDTTRFWWPDEWGQSFWPPGVPREETMAAFVLAYETEGYKSCLDGTLENRREKIAIYTLDGKPKHAARQLDDGQWTSKLGRYEDIRHATLDAIEGPVYGTVVMFMERPR